MSRNIICTIGTSVKTNWIRLKKQDQNSSVDPSEVDAWLESVDPTIASAEINTLNRLGVDENDILIFLHSDTQDGRFCSDRLEHYYRNKVRKIESEELGKLGYGAELFTQGLKSLVQVTVKKVNEAHSSNRIPVFCATGGFKAETAYLSLMGALLEIEVYYIHELHQKLVNLPRLPLTWDAAFVEGHRDFFQWIDSEPRRTEEVETWLKSRPQLRTLVEESEDGFTYLSGAGDLLYRVAKEKLSMGPRAIWPASDPKSPEQKFEVSRIEHHRPAGWESIVNKLCRIDCVSLIRFDTQAYGPTRVKIIDENNGVLGFVYGQNKGEQLPLRIETTARNPEQTNLIYNHLLLHFK